MLDEKRLERQEEGVDKWIKTKDGIFAYATGVGKSLTSQLCIKRLEKEKKHSYLFIAPNDLLVKQYKENIKLFPKHLIERIHLKTIGEVLEEGLRYDVDVLIVDELHEFHTDERIKIFNLDFIKHKHFIGLTASWLDRNFYKISKHKSIIDIIDTEEAIKNGFINEFVEFNLELKLNEKEQKYYNELSERISVYLPRVNNDISLAQKVISGGKDNEGKYWAGPMFAKAISYKNGWHDKLNINNPRDKEIDEIWNPNRILNYARTALNAVRQRKDLLNNCESKFNTSIEILKKFNLDKIIVFSESTTFADRLYYKLEALKEKVVIYHSNLKTIMVTSEKSGKLIKLGKTRLKNLAINNMLEGKARILVTAKSLDKGLNIPNLSFNLTVSGTQNGTQYEQRRGRGLRLASDGVKKPTILVNLYIKDTQDEIWINNRQNNIKHIIHNISSIEEISVNPIVNINIKEM